MAVPLSIPLILSLITGIDSIKTVSKVSVKAGASISIPCLYKQQYINHVKYLCEGYMWSSCSTAVKTSSQPDTRKYSISDDKNQSVFTVTIKQLTDQNTHYWCAVEINNAADEKDYFRLSVTQGTPSLNVDSQTVSGYFGENITINCNYTTSGEKKWCKMNSGCVTERSGFIDGRRVNLNNSGDNRFTVTLIELSAVSSGWYYCAKGDFQMPVHVTVTEKPAAQPTITPTIAGEITTTTHKKLKSSSFVIKTLVIPLSLLILIVIVALFVWLVLKCKHVKADSATSKSSEEAVTYSDVVFKKKKAQARSIESGEEVTYSSVVTAKQKRQKRQSEAEDMDITYTTVFHHK